MIGKGSIGKLGAGLRVVGRSPFRCEKDCGVGSGMRPKGIFFSVKDVTDEDFRCRRRGVKKRALSVRRQTVKVSIQDANLSYLLAKGQRSLSRVFGEED